MLNAAQIAKNAAQKELHRSIDVHRLERCGASGRCSQLFLVVDVWLEWKYKGISQQCQ